MEEYRIKDVDIKQFLHLVIGADGKPPIDFDMLQKEGHYIVHSGQGRDFCLKERKLLHALSKQGYCPELSDAEKLAAIRRLIHDGGYRRISAETANKARAFSIPCFVPAGGGNMEFVRDLNSLDRNLPIYIRAGWDKMLDILVNRKPVPCTRGILKSMEKAARDAYDKAAETDKPQLAGVAVKISFFLEAIDRHCLSGILQGEREKGWDIRAPDFLSVPEKEKFCYLLDEEKRVMMVADRTMEYYGDTR